MRSTLLLLLLCLVLLPFSNATLYGWGRNDQGQLGMGTAAIIYTPTSISFFEDALVFDVLTATNYAIFVLANGTVYGAGLQFYGQFALGFTSTAGIRTPVRCPALNRTLDIVLSGTSCNANFNTNLLGWGNVAGYVQGKTTGTFGVIQTALERYQFDGKVLSVHAIIDGVFIRLANNTVWAAGTNIGGRLGTGTTTPAHTFVPVPFWNNVPLQTIFSSQSRHVCGLSSGNRTLYCWGANDYGQLGVGDVSSYYVPTKVSYFETNRLEVYKVVYGEFHTAVLTCGGRVFIFGANNYGQLGQVILDTSAHPYPIEVIVGAGQKIADITAGIYQTYVRTETNRWFVWGGGKLGSLGLNTSTDAYSPTENFYLRALGINRVRGSSASQNFFGWHDDSVTNDKLSCPALVNECTAGTHTCDINAQCIDFEKGFHCVCPSGYIGDGYQTGTGCIDETSCRALPDYCHENATCSDEIFGPMCTCNDGMQGDGFTCEDKDECLGNPCAVNAVCTNLVPLYRCDCQPNYYGDPNVGGCILMCRKGQFTSGNTCVDCPFGYYSDTNTSTFCKPCPAGSFNDVLGLDDVSGCKKCDIGGYSGLGAKYCSLCIHGYTNYAYATHIDNSTCFPCPLGTYGYYGKCIPCSSGYYNIEPAAKECRNCLPGYYVNTLGEYECLPCPAGQSSRGGTSDCTLCQPGFYSKEGSKDCLKCPPGSTTNGQLGQSNCTKCAAGYFTGRASAQACTACSAGFYANETGSSACKRCPRGTYSTGQATLSCLSCPFPLVAPSTGSTKCVSCDTGYESNGDGITCRACSPGTYLDSLSSQCKSCPAGTFTNVIQSLSCSSCSAGSFSLSGSSYCKRCPANTYSNQETGFATCAPCPLGLKSSGGSSSCS